MLFSYMYLSVFKGKIYYGNSLQVISGGLRVDCSLILRGLLAQRPLKWQ